MKNSCKVVCDMGGIPHILASSNINNVISFSELPSNEGKHMSTLMSPCRHTASPVCDCLGTWKIKPL